jgi:3-dehydroquinate synthase
MQTLQVELDSRSYPIHIGSGLLARADLWRPYLEGRRVAVVTNETVAPMYLPTLIEQIAPYRPVEVVLPDGEQHKTLRVLSRIFDSLLQAHCDRGTVIVALGGGVVGDMAGFAAATYQRGVPFIQIPTTLLAQVDSSVGGKTGVNHALGKNMIGAFYQPRAVVIDTDTLRTLPARELRAGIAEIIKYGAIWDREFFDWLESSLPQLLNLETKALTYAIERSCQIKAEFVARDERESGLRALLNFGHTFGHAIEAATAYEGWLHGEAVAVGMVLAADLSCRLGWLSEGERARLRSLIEAAGLPVGIPRDMERKRLREIMAVDKKSEGGKLRLVLLKRIGDAVVTTDFPSALLDETLAAGQRPA